MVENKGKSWSEIEREFTNDKKPNGEWKMSRANKVMAAAMLAGWYFSGGVGGEVIRRARLKAGNLRKKLPIALKNGMQRTLRIAKNMANAKRNPMKMRGKDNSR